MTQTPKRLLLTNDDGIDAPGLATLERAVRELHLCRVIAPSGPRSGCGQVVSTNEAISFQRREAGRIAISGSPADCVRLAFHTLATDVDFIISGINAGSNLGVDLYHSGTVGAVREGALQGISGIAFSHYTAPGRPVDWDLAGHWVQGLIPMLIDRPLEPGEFWNVNLPHLLPGSNDPQIIECEIDLSPLPLDYRIDGDKAYYQGNYHARPRIAGGDVEVCLAGSIAVSKVRPRG